MSCDRIDARLLKVFRTLVSYAPWVDGELGSPVSAAGDPTSENLHFMDSRILLCRTRNALANKEQIMSRCRWSRIVAVRPENVDKCKKTGFFFYSLGESYGEYNGFLGPPVPPIHRKRRQKPVPSTSSSSINRELLIGFDRINRNDILTFLNMLVEADSVELVMANTNENNRIDAEGFASTSKHALTPTQAAEEWPFIFTDDRRAVRVMKNGI